jgi:hypothetical protein
LQRFASCVVCIIHNRLGKSLIWVTVKCELIFESVMVLTTKFSVLWVVTSLRLVNIRQFSEAPAVSTSVDFCDSLVFRTVHSLIQFYMASRQTRNKYVLNLVVNMFECVSLKDVKVTLLYWNKASRFLWAKYFHGRVKCRTFVLANFNIQLFLNPLQLFFSGLLTAFVYSCREVINCYHILVRPAVTGHCSSRDTTHYNFNIKKYFLLSNIKSGFTI